MIKLFFFLSAISLSTLGISQNRFAFDMFQEMDQNSNLLFSPISIKTAFAMAYEGANNETKKEFETVFNFQSDNSAFFAEVDSLKKVAEISNSLWIQDKFNILKNYTDVIEANFGAAPQYTDFRFDSEGSAKKINAWIEESTNGMLKDVVKAAQVKSFKMAIVNAIYFKQDWLTPFNKKQTRQSDFHNFSGKTIQIDVMHAQSYYRASSSQTEQIIELPYKDQKSAMIIILPSEMPGYELNDSVYNQLTSRLYKQEVILDLPKFTFETPTFELKPFLTSLGLTNAFTDNADFTKMREENDLKIGTALHKAKIIVNEEGTEAAATTIIGMITKTTSMRPNPVMRINVDKPFFYFIKDNETGAILFMGRMNEL